MENMMAISLLITSQRFPCIPFSFYELLSNALAVHLFFMSKWIMLPEQVNRCALLCIVFASVHAHLLLPRLSLERIPLAPVSSWRFSMAVGFALSRRSLPTSDSCRSFSSSLIRLEEYLLFILDGKLWNSETGSDNWGQCLWVCTIISFADTLITPPWCIFAKEDLPFVRSDGLTIPSGVFASALRQTWALSVLHSVEIDESKM